ncbi:MAG TPA: phosphate ABC transporter substrate-binding protein PstS [Gaiellaceae bacterium]
MTRKRLAAAVAALIVVAVALTAGLASAQPTASLSGAGSTFVVPLVTAWTQHYNGASVNYSGIGSGGGISAITARSVDFGASDAPLTPDQASACRGCIQIPWAFSATSIPYNVSGVGYGLKLTGTVIAAIYGGSVKYWDNPAIKKINSGVNLPHEKITPIYRSDGSGTSYNFTDYLSHVSKTWRDKIGKGTQPSFPVGVGARGSSGVAAKLQSTPGGITYVDVAYSLHNHFKIAKVLNRAGKYELPGIKQIQAAANSIRKLHNSQNAFTAVDPNAHAKNAYPICTFSWVIVPQKTGKAAELKKFITWALNKGQSYGPKLLFVPVPKSVKQAGLKTLAKVHS